MLKIVQPSSLLGLFLVMLIMACNSSQKIATKSGKKMTLKQARSYAYGSKMGETVARFGLSKEEREATQFAAGFMRGLEGDSLENVEAQEALQKRLNPSEGKESTTTEEAHKIAYMMGLSAISPLAQEVDVPASDFEEKSFAEGFGDVVKEKELRLETSVRDSLFQAYIEPKGELYQDKMKAKVEAESKANLAAGIAFLEANKKKEGVITTPSGLQYQVLKEGTGAKATIEDQVKTHYHGTLIDGTVFDSSVDRGEPITFGLNQVILGWQEGIPLMKEGAKYRFFIPQELAYGMQSPSAIITGGSTLIFEVELLEVNPE